ncbi:MAG TPA: hypothetical protein VIF86_02745 [Methylobacter sp.]|jgi:hypothetical protein
MLRQLTDDAWSLYLKILKLKQYTPEFLIKGVDKQYKLAERAYRRYERRRDAWERSGFA